MPKVLPYPIGEGGLRDLLKAIGKGQASVQQRIDAAAAAGNTKDLQWAPFVEELIADPSPLVRYYALQALVLDLGVKSIDVSDACWRLLEGDEDADVQSMAAACLGSIYFGTRSRRVFERLKILLQGEGPDLMKGAVYSALFSIAGRPPTDWPGFGEPRWRFRFAEVDWTALRELELELVAQ